MDNRYRLGQPGLSEPGRSKRKGKIYSAPAVIETHQIDTMKTML